MAWREMFYRHLACGDFIRVELPGPPYRSTVLCVSRVEECDRGDLTERQYLIHGNYPRWFPGPIVVSHTDRTDTV